MKIEAGKYYHTRDGRKVGPMVEECPRWSEWPFDVQNEDEDDPISVCLWKDDGICDEGSQYDLVAEWTDAPKLWRDMTAEEKGALLLAHHEGRDIECRYAFNNGWCHDSKPVWADDAAYRVKPTVDSVQCYWNGFNIHRANNKDRTHRITFNLIDGKPDCASIKMEEL